MALKKAKRNGTTGARAITRGAPRSIAAAPAARPVSTIRKVYKGRGFYKTVWGPDIVNRPFATA